jgi:hypothetical protein
LEVDFQCAQVTYSTGAEAYNGHFESTCYHPLLLFNREGDCFVAKLRFGNVHIADGWEEVLLPELDRQMAQGKEVYFPRQRRLCEAEAVRGAGRARGWSISGIWWEVLADADRPGPILEPPGLTPEEKMEVIGATPLARWGGAAEIAKTVLFLVETDFVTGECIRVDGGRYLFWLYICSSVLARNMALQTHRRCRAKWCARSG